MKLEMSLVIGPCKRLIFLRLTDLEIEFNLRGTDELYCIISSIKQPKENQTKLTCKEKVISDNSEVCIEVFFVCLFFPFCIYGHAILPSIK